MDVEDYKQSYEEIHYYQLIFIEKLTIAYAQMAEDEPHSRTLPLQNSEEIDSHLEKLSQSEHDLD